MRRFLIALSAYAISISTSGTAQTAQGRPIREATGPSDEMICRRFLRTGTLADYYRVCKTRADWDRERRNIRQGINVVDACRDRANGGALCMQ
jgi:hypothetical protein